MVAILEISAPLIRRPPKLADPKILSMFTRFAALIAMQLDSEMARQEDQSAFAALNAANELREQFIAILGHDLRNPLQAVYSAGVLLEKKITDPALKGVAARIRVSVKRMSSLINDVLDFARARLGEGMGVRVAEVEDVGRRSQCRGQGISGRPAWPANPGEHQRNA